MAANHTALRVERQDLFEDQLRASNTRSVRRASGLVLAANPDFPVGYGYRALVYWHLGNPDAYVADTVMAMKKNGREEFAEAFAAGYQKAKLKGACIAMIEALKDSSQKQYVSPYEIATYYALMGDRDHTFEWLEKAYAERSGRMEYIVTKGPKGWQAENVQAV